MPGLVLKCCINSGRSAAGTFLRSRQMRMSFGTTSKNLFDIQYKPTAAASFCLDSIVPCSQTHASLVNMAINMKSCNSPSTHAFSQVFLLALNPIYRHNLLAS